MSVFKSEKLLPDDKHIHHSSRQYAGAQRGQISEMTSHEPLSPAWLHAFSPCDFESYRARGEEFRQRLSNAVLQVLKLSEVWRSECECRGEWGGGFSRCTCASRTVSAGWLLLIS